MPMAMEWDWFWAVYRAMPDRQRLEMDYELKRVDLNGWIVAQSPDTIAEIIQNAPLTVMLAYLPLLPIKLARKMQQCRPPSEWAKMNEVYTKSGVFQNETKRRGSRR